MCGHLPLLHTQNLSSVYCWQGQKIIIWLRYKGRYGWVKLSRLIRRKGNIQIFVVEIWMKVSYLQWRYFYEMLLSSDLNCENGCWKTERSACRYFDFISYSALLCLYFHRIEGESDRSGLHNRKKRKVRNILDL